MTYLALYLCTTLVFLALDAVWLRLVAMPMFQRHVGALMVDEPDLKVAGLFYALYCMALVYFAAAPAEGDVGRAFLDAFCSGLRPTALTRRRTWPRCAAGGGAW